MDYVACASLFLVLLVFISGWWLDVKLKLVFAVLVLFLVNELVRIFPAFFYAYTSGQSTIYPLIVFFMGLGALCLGYFTVALFSRNVGVLPALYKEKDFKYTYHDSTYLGVFFVAILMLFPSFYLFQGVPPFISKLLQVLPGGGGAVDISEVGDFRKHITKGHVFGGDYRGQGLIRTLNAVVWPLITAITISSYFVTGEKRWLFLSLLMAFLTFLILSADGTRGPLINAVIFFMVLISFLVRLKFRHIFLVVTGIVLLAIGLSVLSPKLGNKVGSDGFVVAALGKVTERILLDNALNDVYAITLVEQGVFHYRDGALHLRDISAAVPGVGGGKPFAYELFMFMNPNSDATTYATGTYITKAYMDFGLLGVGGIFFLLGVFGAALQFYLLSRRKTVLTFSVSIYLVFLAGRLVLSGPISFSVNFLVVLFFVVFFTFLVKCLNLVARIVLSSNLDGSCRVQG